MRSYFSTPMLALYGAAALALSACAAPTQTSPTAAPQKPPAQPEQPAAADKVTLILDWTPNTNHTGIYVALDKGWYRDEGIELSIQQPGTTLLPAQIVAEGQAQFGISSQEQLVLDRGQGLPIVSIAAIIQHNTSGFAAPAEAKLERPADLVGKRYGAFGAPFEKPFLEALLACDGVEKASEQIEFVQLGPSSDYRAMLGREIDFAWIFYGWDGVAAELEGKPYRMLMLSDYAACVPDYYTPLIFTSEKLINDNPDLVRRFMRATARGYQFAIAQPEEAAEILLKSVPELQPTAETVKASARWLAPRYQAEAQRWGEQQVDVWRNFIEFAQKAGIVQQALDPAQAFTTAFLP